MEVFRPTVSSEAIFHDVAIGPSFRALWLGWDADMRSGKCRTNDHEKDGGQYSIPVDEEGNCVLTGEGKDSEDNDKKFTCTSLVVLKVE